MNDIKELEKKFEVLNKPTKQTKLTLHKYYAKIEI